MITDHFNFAMKSLRQRQLRSWLTIIGILIAVATIFVLISVSVGLQNAVTEQFRMLGSDKFFILPKGQIAGPGTGGAVSLTTDDVGAIEKVSGVKTVSYAAIGNAKIEFNNQIRYFIVIGVPFEKADVFKAIYESSNINAEEGRLLGKNDRGKVMLGNDYKNGNVFSRPIKSGDTVTINGKDFKVAGIISKVGNPSDDRNIIMPLDDFKDLFNSGNRVDEIIVQVQPGNNVDDVSARVEKRLTSFRGLTQKTEDFSISTPEQLLASFGTILNIITAFLVGVAGISLIVGAVGIANTMYTSVLERTREIGTMKAIGAKNSDILLIFLIESGMLGLVGGIIGVLLGYGVSKLIEYIAVTLLATNLLRAAAPFYLIAGCLVFAFVIGVVSGILPAMQASKLRPVDALRYE